MDEINIIVGIIEKEFDVNRDIIKKSIRKNTSKEYGDYSVLCYMLKKNFKESPLIIAKKISYILKENGIESCEVIGPYVNLYIKKDRMLESFFSQFKVEDKSIHSNEKILIINKMKSLSIVTELNDLYKLIINKFIEGLYREQGYNCELYNPIHREKKLFSTNYILENIRNKGLIKRFNHEEIVEFKEFNLPPLIIGDKGYNLTLEDLDYPLHRACDKNISKVIIINNKYEKVRYNQIHSIMEKLDYEIVEKFENISLGLIKLNENIRKYTIYENNSIKLLIKRSREEVVSVLEKSQINIKKVNIERMAIENLIFKFFKKDIGSDIVFDYNESFSSKDNNYLKIKVMEYYLSHTIEKRQGDELHKNYNDYYLNYRLDLINIIEEYIQVIDKSSRNYSSIEIIRLIDRIMEKVYINYGEKIDNEKKYLYIDIYCIMEKVLKLLAIGDNMLINKIQKLTVY